MNFQILIEEGLALVQPESKRIIINLAGRKRTGKETAYKLLSPYVQDPKEFQFATPPKRFCIEALGLSHSQLYGTTTERESPTKYKWGSVDPQIRAKYDKAPNEVMTARDVIQVFGTDLMREKFYKRVWAEAGIRQVERSTATTAFFTDTRFEEEIEESNAYSSANADSFLPTLNIRLYRKTGFTDPHTSEKALDNWDVVPNQNQISPDIYSELRDRGYEPLATGLWRVVQPTPFKFQYLVDNNYQVDQLRHNLITILKTEGLYIEPGCE